MVINSVVPILSFSPVSESHVTTGWMSLTKLREKQHELLEWEQFHSLTILKDSMKTYVWAIFNQHQ